MLRPEEENNSFEQLHFQNYPNKLNKPAERGDKSAARYPFEEAELFLGKSPTPCFDLSDFPTYEVENLEPKKARKEETFRFSMSPDGRYLIVSHYNSPNFTFKDLLTNAVVFVKHSERPGGTRIKWLDSCGLMAFCSNDALCLYKKDRKIADISKKDGNNLNVFDMGFGLVEKDMIVDIKLEVMWPNAIVGYINGQTVVSDLRMGKDGENFASKVMERPRYVWFSYQFLVVVIVLRWSSDDNVEGSIWLAKADKEYVDTPSLCWQDCEQTIYMHIHGSHRLIIRSDFYKLLTEEGCTLSRLIQPKSFPFELDPGLPELESHTSTAVSYHLGNILIDREEIYLLMKVKSIPEVEIRRYVISPQDVRARGNYRIEWPWKHGMDVREFVRVKDGVFVVASGEGVKIYMVDEKRNRIFNLGMVNVPLADMQLLGNGVIAIFKKSESSTSPFQFIQVNTGIWRSRIATPSYCNLTDPNEVICTTDPVRDKDKTYVLCIRAKGEGFRIGQLFEHNSKTIWKVPLSEEVLEASINKYRQNFTRFVIREGKLIHWTVEVTPPKAGSKKTLSYGTVDLKSGESREYEMDITANQELNTLSTKEADYKPDWQYFGKDKIGYLVENADTKVMEMRMLTFSVSSEQPMKVDTISKWPVPGRLLYNYIRQDSYWVVYSAGPQTTLSSLGVEYVNFAQATKHQYLPQHLSQLSKSNQFIEELTNTKASFSRHSVAASLDGQYLAIIFPKVAVCALYTAPESLDSTNNASPSIIKLEREKLGLDHTDQPSNIIDSSAVFSERGTVLALQIATEDSLQVITFYSLADNSQRILDFHKFLPSHEDYFYLIHSIQEKTFDYDEKNRNGQTYYCVNFIKRAIDSTKRELERAQKEFIEKHLMCLVSPCFSQVILTTQESKELPRGIAYTHIDFQNMMVWRLTKDFYTFKLDYQMLFHTSAGCMPLLSLNTAKFIQASRETPPDSTLMKETSDSIVSLLESRDIAETYRHFKPVLLQAYLLNNDYLFDSLMTKVVDYLDLTKHFHIFALITSSPRKVSIGQMINRIEDSYSNTLIGSVVDSKSLREVIVSNYRYIIACDVCKELLTRVLLVPTGQKVESELEDEFTSVTPLDGSADSRSVAKSKLLLQNPQSIQTLELYETGFNLDLSKGCKFSSTLFKIIKAMDSETLTEKYKGLVYYKWSLYFPSVFGYSVLYWANLMISYIYFGYFPNQFPLLIIIIILSSLFLIFELKCMLSNSTQFRRDNKKAKGLEQKVHHSQTLEYLLNPANYYDVLTLVFTIIAAVLVYSQEDYQLSNYPRYVWLRMLPVVLLGCRSITWLRVFTPTRYLITSVMSVFLAMVPFLTILLLFTLIFAFMWRLSDGLSGDNFSAEESTFYQSLTSSLNVIFGNIANPFDEPTGQYPTSQLASIRQ